jgi:hypothetical protein
MNAKTKTVNIEGMKKAAAMEALIKGGMSYPDAEAHWKENGSKRGAAGFRSKFYEECLKRNFDKESFTAYAQKSGASENDIKGAAHYLAISALVERAKGLNA